jgi:hypothetical protein
VIGEAVVHFVEGVLHVDRAYITSEGMDMLGIRLSLISYKPESDPTDDEQAHIEATNTAWDNTDLNDTENEK